MNRAAAVMAVAVGLSACGAEPTQDEAQGAQELPPASTSPEMTTYRCGFWGMYTCLTFTPSEACGLVAALEVGEDQVQRFISNPVIALAVWMAFTGHEGWFRDNIGTHGLELDYNPFLGVITEAKPIGGPCPGFCSTFTCPGSGGSGPTCRHCSYGCCGSVDANGCCDDLCMSSAGICQ